MVVPSMTGITSYDMMLISDIVRKPCATVGVDMDERMIFNHVGVDIDPLLIDQMP
jgi:hypothetical protein